jgi:hypothetical protein
MSAVLSAVLAQAEALGVELSRQGDRLLVDWPGDPDPALRKFLVAYKAEILAGLPDQLPPPLLSALEDFEERAAILEFEAGLSREEAEARASAMIWARWGAAIQHLPAVAAALSVFPGAVVLKISPLTGGVNGNLHA